jgi:deoxyribodipyrimidine photolyase-like uncharacterized protein
LMLLTKGLHQLLTKQALHKVMVWCQQSTTNRTRHHSSKLSILWSAYQHVLKTKVISIKQCRPKSHRRAKYQLSLVDRVSTTIDQNAINQLLTNQLKIVKVACFAVIILIITHLQL